MSHRRASATKLVLLACALAACGPSTPRERIVSDPLDPTDGEEGDVILPELRQMGQLAPGRYLFRASAVGADGHGLVPVQLISNDPDFFVVSVDGGPHRQVAHEAGWPMACLRSALDIEEAALRLHLDVGAPVLVLASSRGGARISIGLDMEHSRVVHPTSIDTESCDEPAPATQAGRIASVAAGDRACLFADQETLDESVGLAVESGLPARVREEDGEWVNVRVEVPGGYAAGWMSAEAFERGSPSVPESWDLAAIGGGRCLFPGRSNAEAHTDALELHEDPNAPPMIPPEAIERVLRQGETQIRTCYEARLNEVPDLSLTMEILILVDPDGHVDRAEVTRGRTADDALTRCALDVARRWRFLPPRTGAVTLRRSFELRPPPATP
ncbi:MAG: TonB family protein [Sandaracinaceae bacterium]